MKRLNKTQSGQSIIEVVIASSLFLIAAIGALSVTFQYFDAIQRSRDISESAIVLQESVEAVRSISYDDFASIADGTYGLELTGSEWTLGSTPDLVDNTYTRTITVSSVSRDEDCAIVDSGGVDDPDSKQVAIQLDWVTDNNNFQQELTTQVRNWPNHTSGCTVTQAASININVSFANLDSTKKQVEGITIENTGLNDVVIDTVTISWIKEDETSPGESESVKIDGSDVWHKNGTGSPAGGQPSGTELDIIDVTVPAETTINVDRLRFNEKLDGSQFTLTLKMGDESQTEVTTEGFLP